MIQKRITVYSVQIRTRQYISYNGYIMFSSYPGSPLIWKTEKVRECEKWITEMPELRKNQGNRKVASWGILVAQEFHSSIYCIRPVRFVDKPSQEKSLLNHRTL